VSFFLCWVNLWGGITCDVGLTSFSGLRFELSDGGVYATSRGQLPNVHLKKNQTVAVLHWVVPKEDE
jgi:hypothetical protein